MRSAIGPWLRDLGWRFDDPIGDAALGVVGFAACAGAVLGGMLLANGSLPLAAIKAGIAATPPGARLLLVGTGIAVAFVEESFFRGWLQRVLVARIGLARGIVVGAALFAVAHLDGAPATLLARGGIGVVLGALRGRDRSLLAPAVAHVLVWAVFGRV